MVTLECLIHNLGNLCGRAYHGVVGHAGSGGLDGLSPVIANQSK